MAAAEAATLQEIKMGDSVFYVVSITRVPDAALPTGMKFEEAFQLSREEQAGLHGQSLNAWLFQSNPALYDLRRALASLQEQVWSVSRYAKEIRMGDRVYLWEAGRHGGVAGVAEVSEPARLQSEPPEQLPFARVAAAFAGDRVRAKLKILRVIEPLIALQSIVSCPELSTLIPEITYILNAGNVHMRLEKLKQFQRVRKVRQMPTSCGIECCIFLVGNDLMLSERFPLGILVELDSD